jgi:hypothetical protein
MKRILLVTLLAILSLGFVNAQITNNGGHLDLITTTKDNTIKDTMMNGRVYGHPKINHEKNGSHTLGQTYNDSLCGLNYVTGSVLIETRYNQYATNTFGSGFPATISITGLIPCHVIQAYLWWTVFYQTGSSIAPIVALTNPAAVTSQTIATLAGSDGYKCWGESGTRTFRADVTASISGNGIYTIDSIHGNTAWEVDGATLLIIVLL